MTDDPALPEPCPKDEMWRQILLHNPPASRRRRWHRRIPSAPRCKLCNAPFAGIGGMVMSRMGHARWAKNPKYCAGCFRMLRENHGGAEIECSLLFADVRGSTTLAEQVSPREFNRLMGSFFDVASEILVNHDAFVDKFVGDEIIGIFVPAMATGDHARRAIDAATSLMGRTMGSTVGGRSIPIGAGVSTGIAYVGSIGQGPDAELTAMGDMVNTTARLASAAAAGEILVTAAAAAAAGLPASMTRRSLELKGKSEPTDVVVLTMS
ncbi:MAG: adenylate/guanylate cyclase domain-containing protein [Candidatus Limnocylindrales bacterium]